jgi:3-hydroxyacyl-[acyl-carrier-protein] dehydratase
MTDTPKPPLVDARGISRILPHRFPFVLVDRVVSLSPGERIVAYKNVSMNEPWVPGHFPGRPVMPGVLIVEALAQAGGLLAHATEPFDPDKKLLFFLGIDGCKFRRPVTPGDRLDLTVEVTRRRSNIWKLEGQAHVDGILCAEAGLLAGILDRDDTTA